MFPLFHIAVPLVLFELPPIKRRLKVNRFALILGAFLPDIIDKFLLLLKISSGRGISHTLLFVGIVSLIAFFISKKNLAISIPFLSGNIIHLILDLPYVPLFYPFIPYDFSMVENPIGGWFYSLLHNPLIYGTELAGLGILIFIMVSNKLYSFNHIITYLKTQEP
ncbi:MAG: metal-dependent hydrolase [Promethearchaeia archaeon]